MMSFEKGNFEIALYGSKRSYKKKIMLLLKALDYNSKCHWLLKIKVYIYNCLMYNLSQQTEKNY